MRSTKRCTDLRAEAMNLHQNAPLWLRLAVMAVSVALVAITWALK